LQNQPKLQRKLRQLACVLAVPAMAAGSILGGTKPVLAEFQIQEAGIEKGEVEIEYRGAYHWGVPEATEANPNANDLIQSHELELSMGINDWWLIQVTGGFDQPLHENLQGNSVEIETEFAIIKRQGDGIALSFQLGYEQALNNHSHIDGEASEFGFGPIVEVASGKFLLTLNPLFTKQIGTFADQEGLGFEYGWRGEYDFAKHWGVGIEMFGEIEDLSNPGSFNDQNHSIGPTLFWNPGGAENDDETAGNGDDDDGAKGKGKEPEPSETSFSMNVGYQFGLTDATSDGALKFQGSLSF
jgi:hypothetical protein